MVCYFLVLFVFWGGLLFFVVFLDIFVLIPAIILIFGISFTTLLIFTWSAPFVSISSSVCKRLCILFWSKFDWNSLFLSSLHLVLICSYSMSVSIVISFWFMGPVLCLVFSVNMIGECLSDKFWSSTSTWKSWIWGITLGVVMQ